MHASGAKMMLFTVVVFENIRNSPISPLEAREKNCAGSKFRELFMDKKKKYYRRHRRDAPEIRPATSFYSRDKNLIRGVSSGAFPSANRGNPPLGPVFRKKKRVPTAPLKSKYATTTASLALPVAGDRPARGSEAGRSRGVRRTGTFLGRLSHPQESVGLPPNRGGGGMWAWGASKKGRAT